MPFRIFGKSDASEIATQDEGYVEVGITDSTEQAQAAVMSRVGIKIEKLNDFSDTDRVLRMIRSGNVIFLKIKGLKEKDMGELKRAVEKLKKTIMANNGDIAGIEQDWLVLTPENINVER